MPSESEHGKIRPKTIGVRVQHFSGTGAGSNNALAFCGPERGGSRREERKGEESDRQTLALNSNPAEQMRYDTIFRGREGHLLASTLSDDGSIQENLFPAPQRASERASERQALDGGWMVMLARGEDDARSYSGLNYLMCPS
eukprot:scaffold6881_cov154-Skeletonema_menzelii.AAC.2